MIKQFFFLIILFFIFHQTSAQKTNSLFYFISKKEALVGVMDSKGNTIIPAIYENYSGILNREKIPDNQAVIVMTRFENSNGKAAAIAGDAFDRKGTLLHHPLVYDAGPDYYVEGFRRCVENGKVGFANEEGKIVIEPQWDWADPFNYGYSEVCNGCYLDRTIDAEHAILAYSPDGESYYIDKTGSTTTDSGKYLTYPLKYTLAEQQMIDSFHKIKAITQIANAHYYNGTLPAIQFEITVKPLPQYPYYQIQGYRNFSLDDELIFIIDKRGNWFHYEPFGNQKTVFKKWLKERTDALK
jgi:hypothetical protein